MCTGLRISLQPFQYSGLAEKQNSKFKSLMNVFDRTSLTDKLSIKKIVFFFKRVKEEKREKKVEKGEAKKRQKEKNKELRSRRQKWSYF